MSQEMYQEAISQILHDTPSNVVISAVHAAMRYMSHINTAVLAGYRDYHPTLSEITDAMDEESIRKAQEILKTIEENEAVGIGQLSKKTVESYISLLTRLMFSETERDFPRNEQRGKELLANLRHSANVGHIQ